ncbi:hypothetical protein Dimus_012705 [Dionaea muscipula]
MDPDVEDDGNLDHQDELLQDFDLFESTFLQPYEAETNIGTGSDDGMNWTIELEASKYEGSSSGNHGNGIAAAAAGGGDNNMLNEQEIYLEVDDFFERNLWLQYWNVSILEDFNMDSITAQNNNKDAGKDAAAEAQYGNGDGEILCSRGVPETGSCCGGKCQYAMEDLIKAMEKPQKGRRKKGYKPTPQQLAAAKHLQKLRNRDSAARATARKKAHITNLQSLVLKLRAENRLRKKLLKFLEMENSLKLPKINGSLRRTASGPV